MKTWHFGLAGGRKESAPAPVAIPPALALAAATLREGDDVGARVEPTWLPTNSLDRHPVDAATLFQFERFARRENPTADSVIVACLKAVLENRQHDV